MTHLNEVTSLPAIGVDLGDKSSAFCRLNADGALVEASTFAMSPEGLRETFSKFERSRVALEAGTQAAWVHDELLHLGHEVVVYDAADFARREGGKRKSDRKDAEALARALHMNDERIKRVQMRSPRGRQALAMVRARDVQVRMRARGINALRGLLKQFGIRLPTHSSESFAGKVRDRQASLPAELWMFIAPLLGTLDALNESIKTFDREVETLARKEFPQAQRLIQISGVGALTALTFVLVIGDVKRFKRCRDVGAYLGLVPKLRESGSSQPQLGIEKTGDGLARRILVQAAHHKLSRQTVEDDLRTWGLELCKRNAKRGKKVAAVAVARKLAVAMFAMLAHDEDYDPKRMSKQRLRRHKRAPVV